MKSKVYPGILTLILVLVLWNPLSHIAAQEVSGQELGSETIRNLKLKLVDRINQDRRFARVPPVAFLDDFSLPADAHCREMLILDYTNHWNQSGLKPYMRYSLTGITDFTSENIASLFATLFTPTLYQLEQEMANRHDAFMLEKPPNDLHRQAVLDPWHTHVGIGIAFGRNNLKLVEVFARRYVEVKPLPARANLSDKLSLAGKILVGGLEVQAISVFYESLPEKQSFEELRTLRNYGLPEDRLNGRPLLRPSLFYADGTVGEIQISGNNFLYPISFFRKKPGVYTVVIWLKRTVVPPQDSPAFMATNICIFVEK
jgi:uncharacterized protein YkwD